MEQSSQMFLISKYSTLVSCKWCARFTCARSILHTFLKCSDCTEVGMRYIQFQTVMLIFYNLKFLQYLFNLRVRLVTQYEFNDHLKCSKNQILTDVTLTYYLTYINICFVLFLKSRKISSKVEHLPQQQSFPRYQRKVSGSTGSCYQSKKQKMQNSSSKQKQHAQCGEIRETQRRCARITSGVKERTQQQLCVSGQQKIPFIRHRGNQTYIG